jgi:uncharacterized paraquat-inducible protein A
VRSSDARASYQDLPRTLVDLIECAGCGGRNPANSVACAFCQHPIGTDRRRPLLQTALVLLGALLLVIVLVAVLRPAILIPIP